MGNWQATVRIGEFVVQWRKGDLGIMHLNNFLNSEDFENEADMDSPASVNTLDEVLLWLHNLRVYYDVFNLFPTDKQVRHDIVTFAILCSRFQDCDIPFKWEDVLIDGCCIEKLTWY